MRIERRIGLPEIKEVNISNEFMGTRLTQGEPGEVMIIAELLIRSSGDVEIKEEDLIEVNINESKGKVEIDITEPDLDEDDYDISERSSLTIVLPPEIKVKAETENNFIIAEGLQNNLDLTSENGSLKVIGCTGNINITNENGLIKLEKVIGELSINEENGPISGDDLSGGKLSIKSENGAIKLRSCQYEDVEIHNENGMVFYESLLVDGGSIDIKNENGHISLTLSPMQGFVLNAKAELGQIKNNFITSAGIPENGMFDTYNLEIGDKSMQINLVTENGMIKLNSSDMLGSDFFHGKLDFIKEMLKDNSEQGLKEAQKIIGQLIASLTKLIEKVSEEGVKEKIEQALKQLKEWKGRINEPELKDSVKNSFDSISTDVGKAVQEALKAAQEAMKATREKYQEEFKPHIEKHFGRGKDFVRHFRGFRFDGFPYAPPPPHSEKEAMQDKARLKILEMLEAGKIT